MNKYIHGIMWFIIIGLFTIGMVYLVQLKQEKKNLIKEEACKEDNFNFSRIQQKCYDLNQKEFYELIEVEKNQFMIIKERIK